LKRQQSDQTVVPPFRMIPPQNITFKYVVVGDSGVGKTCLVDQFTHKRFQEAHLTTIGVNLSEVIKTVPINQSEVRLQIWDTAGMEVYRSLTTAYYRNTAVTLLLYDVTRRGTFESLPRWIGDIRESCNNAHMLIFIIGNKIDLSSDRQVSRQEGQKFATQHKLFFSETSAKVNETVEKVFVLATRLYYEKIDMGHIDIYNHPTIYGVKLNDDSDDCIFDNVSNNRSNCQC